jgi:hypothetical protein
MRFKTTQKQQKYSKNMNKYPQVGKTGADADGLDHERNVICKYVCTDDRNIGHRKWSKKCSP